jgi:hypothetical protein
MPSGGVVGERRHVLAGELDEIGSESMTLLGHTGEIGGRVLHAGDVLQFVEPRHGGDGHVDHRPGWDIVDDDRNADRVVHGLEMLIQAFLRRLVIIGRDDEQGIRARLFAMPGEFDRLDRVVRAGTGDHRHPALRLGDAPFDDFLVLVMGQRRALARRSHRNKAPGAVLDLPIDVSPEGLLVERAVLERRHQGGHRAFQHSVRSHSGAPCPALRLPQS